MSHEFRLSRITQEFLNPIREARFQTTYWTERSRQNQTVALIWAVIIIGVLINFLGNPWEIKLTFFFTIEIAGCAIILWLSRRSLYQSSYEPLLTLTVTAMLMSIVSFVLIQPDNSLSMALFIMAPLIVTIALNIRSYYTLLLLGVIILSYSWALRLTELDIEFTQLMALQILVASGIGFVIHRLINSSRRSDIARLWTEQLYSQKIEEAREVAEKANEHKSLFLAQASHDIRTPMNGILGLSRLLRKTPLSSRQRALLESIQASSNSLLNLMNQLLDLTRIESGKLELQETINSPQALVQEVVSLLTPLAEEKGLSISIHSMLPSSLLIKTDSGRLKQILTNLLSNAIQYTDQGTIRLELNCRHEIEEHLVLKFKVTNPGEGITEDLQKEMYQAFSRGSADQNPYGVGLGLSISKQLAKAIRGSLEYEFEERLGSCFTLTLKAEKETSITLPSPQSASPIRNLENCSILIVEDNRINALVLKESLLEFQKSAQISVVTDGQKAVDACSENHFDYIFMDCQLPKLDGFSALKKIRSFPDFKETPIIAVTASASQEHKELCHASGFNAFLAKPIEPESLQNIFRSSNISDGIEEHWNTAAALKQMNGKRSVLEQAVRLALQDLPPLAHQLDPKAYPSTKKVKQVIHQIRGGLQTLHTPKTLADLEGYRLSISQSRVIQQASYEKFSKSFQELETHLKMWSNHKSLS
ncbi:MAG: response regulator [Verrucomicrobiota bacterium]